MNFNIIEVNVKPTEYVEIVRPFYIADFNINSLIIVAEPKDFIKYPKISILDVKNYTNLGFCSKNLNQDQIDNIEEDMANIAAKYTVFVKDDCYHVVTKLKTDGGSDIYHGFCIVGKKKV